MLKKYFWSILVLCFVVFLMSCSDDDDNNPVDSPGGFSSLSSPYLVCANRNPGGVGFDFVYNDNNGGSNNLDSLTVTDFNSDITIKTIKAEKDDGSLSGMPYIALSENVKAVNYSTVDTDCKGYSSFQALTLSSLQNYNLKSDDNSFDLTNLTTGETGKPLVSAVKTEYAKLVIGQKWKTSANNDTEGDELIWIIQTSEGRLVKLIVTDFPADPAPTATGYIALEWEVLD